MLRLAKLWLPVIAWASLIFWLSSIPGLKTDLGIWDFVFRKSAHMIEFAVLTFLIFRALQGSLAGSAHSVMTGFMWTNEFKGSLAASVLFSLGYSISDEWHQSFVNERVGVWTDVVIDSLGIAAAAIVLWRANSDRTSSS